MLRFIALQLKEDKDECILFFLSFIELCVQCFDTMSGSGIELKPVGQGAGGKNILVPGGETIIGRGPFLQVNNSLELMIRDRPHISFASRSV